MRKVACLFFQIFIITACTSHLEIPTSATAVTTETVSVVDFISNPDYNKECKDLNLTSYQSQVDFLGIYPGKSTEGFVRDTLGEPSDVFNGDADEIIWFYDNRADIYISVRLVDKIVNKIEIVNISKKEPALISIIEKYGCPSIIELVNTSDDEPGYNFVLFTYPEIGMEYWFENNKVKFTSIPSDVKYFKPVTLIDYIQKWGDFLFFGSPLIEPVDWNEVLVDE